MIRHIPRLQPVQHCRHGYFSVAAQLQNHGIDWADYPHFQAWFDAIAARPAVQRGVQVLADLRRSITDDKAREVLFGKTQYQER